MTREQVQALVNYTKALVAERMDDMSSADQGLSSYGELLRAETELFKQLVTETGNDED